MRTPEKDTKLKEAIGEDCFNQLAAKIGDIERSIPTTRNHYGKYMAALSGLTKEQQQTYASLFLYFGANRQGVIDALKLCCVEVN